LAPGIYPQLAPTEKTSTKAFGCKIPRFELREFAGIGVTVYIRKSAFGTAAITATLGQQAERGQAQWTSIASVQRPSSLLPAFNTFAPSRPMK